MNFPKVVQEQSSKNALYIGLIILLMVGSIWLVMIFGFGQSGGDAFFITILICLSGMMIFYLYTILSNTRKSGKVLLDIMQYPNRKWAFIGAGGGLIMMILGIVDYVMQPRGTLAGDFLPIVSGLYNLLFQGILGFSRLQIREKGFWIYGLDLLTWDKIESFEWIYDGGKFFALKLVLKRKPFALFQKPILTVPIRKKQPLENLLQLHLPYLAS